jgi:hypothetical protein
MAKIDYLKLQPELYKVSAKAPVLVEVPPFSFLMVDGVGDPEISVWFQEAAEALFAASYTLKFMVKKEQAQDYGVLPLEGLWAMADGSPFDVAARDLWKWTLMIRQPEFVNQDLVTRALAQVRVKKDLPALAGLRFSRFHEGLSAQVLHIGPYGDETPTIAALHRFIKEKGYFLGGRHHEIYLGDPRRTAPERLKTILRQPITLEAAR